MRLFYTLAFVYNCTFAVLGQQFIPIHGIIHGHDKKPVSLYTINNYLENKPAYLANVTTDAKGRFTSTISLSTAQSIMLHYGNDYPMLLWVEPGDSIFIDIARPYIVNRQKNIDILHKGSVLYSGRGARINNYLFAADLAIYNPKTHGTAADRSVGKYYGFLDSLQHAREQLRQNMYPQKFSSTAETFLQGEIVSTTFYHKSQAEVYKANKTVEDSALLETPDAYWQHWKFQTDTALASAGYRHSLISYCSWMAKKKIRKRAVTNREREIHFSTMYHEAYGALQHLPLTREFATAFALHLMTMFIDGRDSLTVLLQDFHQKFPTSPYYPILAGKLESKKKIMERAPEMVAFDTTNSLFSLSKLKGKIIYIDVWASWCGPCMKELPNSNRLAEKFKDKIYLVYLNIDDKEDTWRRVIKKQKLKGIHLRADPEKSRKIRSDFTIGPIPRYILIDKNGNVVQSHAANPSDVVPDILSLLN
jgi:thiol-disulfide isomerase/thioredoxin